MTRILGLGVPHDAQPGDLIVGNRGAAAFVETGLGVVWLEYAGNYHDGFLKPRPGRKLHDLR